VFSHINWVNWIKEKFDVEIKFPIIADTGEVANILGLIHPKKGTNTVRAVFIVEAIQIADKNGVAMPANWPNNEIIGDHVIIPPA